MESTLGDRCDRGIPATDSRGLRHKCRPYLTPMSVALGHFSRVEAKKSPIQQGFTLIDQKSSDSTLESASVFLARTHGAGAEP